MNILLELDPRTPKRAVALLRGALLTALFIALLTACQSAPRPIPTGQELLEGHWEGSGPGGPCAVTISGNSLYFESRPDFWYRTTFTMPADAEIPQFHATIIADSTGEQRDIGTVVVAIYKFEDGKLTLGVIGDYQEPPTGPVAASWEWGMDLFDLEKAQPNSPGANVTGNAL